MSAEPMKQAFAGAQPLTYAPRRRPEADKEALVRQYLPLVRRIAWHVHGSMSTIVDVEDLVQIGLVALVEAVGQAAEQGAQFRAYLQTRLRGAMIDELRRQATTTRRAVPGSTGGRPSAWNGCTASTTCPGCHSHPPTRSARPPRW